MGVLTITSTVWTMKQGSGEAGFSRLTNKLIVGRGFFDAFHSIVDSLEQLGTVQPFHRVHAALKRVPGEIGTLRDCSYSVFKSAQFV